jgi:tight adherence protein B
VLLGSAALALLLALGAIGLTGMIWVAVGAAPLGGMLPFLYLGLQQRRRYAAFQEGFPDALELMARSASAGHALPGTFQMVADEGPEPVASEFRRIAEEQKFGRTLRDSLLGLTGRVPVTDIRMFSTAILLHRETGGNLAESLQNLAYLMRERVKLGREIRTRSAHARMTGWVVGLAPLLLLGIFQVVHPAYIAPLIMETEGRILLGGAFLLQGFGFLMVHRMTRLEV